MNKVSNKEKKENINLDNKRRKNEWRRKGWSIPDLCGRKNEWFTLVKNLVILVNDNQAMDLDSKPIMPGYYTN